MAAMECDMPDGDEGAPTAPRLHTRPFLATHTSTYTPVARQPPFSHGLLHDAVADLQPAMAEAASADAGQREAAAATIGNRLAACSGSALCAAVHTPACGCLTAWSMTVCSMTASSMTASSMTACSTAVWPAAAWPAAVCLMPVCSIAVCSTAVCTAAASVRACSYVSVYL